MTDQIFQLLVEQAGPFAMGAGVMILWLRSAQKQLESEKKSHDETRSSITQMQEDRIGEMQKQMEIMRQFQLLLERGTTTKP